MRGDWEGLLEEAQAEATAARARRAGAAGSTGLAGAALAGEAIRRVSLGDLGRAAQLLGQAKVAAPSPEVREELQGPLVTLVAERVSSLRQGGGRPRPGHGAAESATKQRRGTLG